MVHRVAAARLDVALAGIDDELLLGVGDLRGAAGEADQAGMEGAEIRVSTAGVSRAGSTVTKIGWTRAARANPCSRTASAPG